MGCGCTETTKECILRYTGETIDCLGIEKNELIETAIQTLAENICLLNDNASCCQEVVLYSENALGAESITISPTLFTLPGTTYTVPTGGAGTYELSYVGQTYIGNSGGMSIFIYKNGAVYHPATTRTIAGAKDFVIPFNVFASNIVLAEGDEIKLITAANAETIYPQNAVYKLTKIN